MLNVLAKVSPSDKKTSGLTEGEAAERLRSDGPNELLASQSLWLISINGGILTFLQKASAEISPG